jgi:hypothetical protein
MASRQRGIEQETRALIELLSQRDREAQAAYRTAEDEARKVRAELLEAVRASGLPLRTVAPLLGMSAQRLHVLLRRERP